MDRRSFLKSAAVLSTASTLPPLAPAVLAAEGEPARVRKYNVLGKTGLKMSDISFGAGKLPSASMILRAVDRGINYFDTAPDYGQSEKLIGEALSRHKGRDKMYLASKFCRAVPYQDGISHLYPGATKAEYIASVEESLKRMNTDYLDVVFVHALGEKPEYEAQKQRLTDPEMLAAVADLKKAGKVRALAVSSHGAHNMETLALDAVQTGHYDILMLAFNFLTFPKVPEVLKAAHAKGVGIIAMKTLAGAKDSGVKPEGATPFPHAAFKWVLQHPEVSGLVVTIKTTDELDLYLQASGQAFAAADQRALDHYAALFGSDYCRTGCGTCQSACPAGVEIGAILRHHMYFADYGDEKRAMQEYAGLERNAAVCETCADNDACNAACPYGLTVGEKLRAAHRTLSWDAPVAKG
ncbi:MAG: aldo/keto reductase [Magnetococcales bacterium]|nr:aldo/keto reductase [Magnetococcales bacterium]